MAEAFGAAREMVGETVRMRFADGHEVVAVLFSVTTDTDGSQHMVFGDVVWSSETGSYDGSANTCYYADGRTLVGVEREGAAG